MAKASGPTPKQIAQAAKQAANAAARQTKLANHAAIVSQNQANQQAIKNAQSNLKLTRIQARTAALIPQNSTSNGSAPGLPVGGTDSLPTADTSSGSGGGGDIAGVGAIDPAGGNGNSASATTAATTLSTNEYILIAVGGVAVIYLFLHFHHKK